MAESARLGDLQKWLDECLDRLPLSDRDLFRLHYQSNLSAKGLAEQLGRPLSTVYNTISRVRRRLAECVERAMSGGGPT